MGKPELNKVSDYRRHARECEALAKTAKPEHRDMLLNMAATWESLAVAREKQLAKQGVLSNSSALKKNPTNCPAGSTLELVGCA
jgi:hypothetical protein